tara:strand:- start:1911 stop:2465 length:555 start_codon:yes stop_codon:yes gene_type:complete
MACRSIMLVEFPVTNLSYMTNDSSSPLQIIAKDRDMCEVLGPNFYKLPTKSDFVEILCMAAKIDATSPGDGMMLRGQAIVHYFLDVGALPLSMCHLKPSLAVAAAIMCTLRVLHRPDWNARLEFYSGHAEPVVRAWANRLVVQARTCWVSILAKKYTRAQYGGVCPKHGTRGAWHVIKTYLALA